MRKKLAALALGISLLTLGATVANAQLGKLLKTLEDTAAQLQTPAQTPDSPAPAAPAAESASISTPTPSTLAGRWVPVAESCAGVKGVSERMIELKGKEMNGAFASCQFPAAISSRTAYKGSMSCSDEEGGETNKSVSIAIQQNGTMLWGEREGPGPISQDAYKKCSPAPRFPNE